MLSAVDFYKFYGAYFASRLRATFDLRAISQPSPDCELADEDNLLVVLVLIDLCSTM